MPVNNKTIFCAKCNKLRYMGITELSDIELCTCEGQDKIATYSKRESKTVNFKTSGFIGDIMHALPAIKELSRKTGFNAHLYIFIDRTWNNFEDSTREHQGLISEGNYERLRPLLMALPFIENVSQWKGEKIHYDLDVVKYRGGEIGLPHSNISRWYFYCFPEATCDLSERIIDLQDLEAEFFQNQSKEVADEVSGQELISVHHPKRSIIVNRTARNTNPYINYMFLNQYEDVWFVGTIQEYEMFAHQVPNAKYQQVDDFLRLAILIGNCGVFIGNQSFCYSIAEMMKVPRVLEACKEATNVTPIGKNGYDFYTQHGLETIVAQLTKQQ